jgi:putative ABC transport system ATP-binding protein
MVLKVSGLKKSYITKKETEVKALNGISLEVGKGELVEVKGPSGCGKTTLLLICGGLLCPDEGEILLNNNNLYNISSQLRDKQRAENIGFVFQQFYLIPYLNVLENVMIPAAGLNSPSASLKDKSEELIRKFNLIHRINHMPAELSTGERQRVALARALINDPKILLADEPTGNLDNENAGIVLNHISDFAKEGGAVLLVTHDTRISTNAHRKYVMKEGIFI